MANEDQIQHLLDLARQGAKEGASGNEKQARAIIISLQENVVGLDASAVAGIGALARFLYEDPQAGRERLLDYLQPPPPGPYLDLRHEPSGLRHYLQGKPLSAGELIEVFTRADGWELARYEWSYVESKSPYACFSEDEVIIIEDDTPVRRPKGHD